jgi:hypothetical protein
MEVGEAKRLRTLEEENLRLKPLVAASLRMPRRSRGQPS